MKILWAKSDFLHPTERGGQIRTLETLRRLHRDHELHYIAYDDPARPEGMARASEYCSAAYPIAHHVPPRRSLAFVRQAVANLVDPLPLSIARYRSTQMRDAIARLMAQHRYDAVVCDFLAMAPNFADLGQCILFQHNVEYTIWQRHAQHAPDPLRRLYFQSQFRRTLAYERASCRAAAHIIAVSGVDRDLMASQFGVDPARISVVPTGVDVDYFAPPPSAPPVADLVFVGAMDWMPNIDGIDFFVSQVLPLIRRRLPHCSLVIAGRSPGPAITALAAADPLIQVTGTVPDVRPYIWGSKVAIVPLRIGGGTRLKIYEAMAAGKPVVSTTVGAEGLDVDEGVNIFRADDAQSFADRCLQLLDDPALHARLGSAARSQAARFSWDSIAQHFESILLKVPPR